MRFVWFWTFWHWSKESFRDGLLLRSPLQGVGGHWDEWFRHEAPEEDRHAIEKIGGAESSQREFIAWLLTHWAPEVDFKGNGLARHFILNQLSHVPPFKQWAAFNKYGANYGVGGVPAIVLAEGSEGEAGDVRSLEAVALPSDVAGPSIVPDGFHADSIDLEMPRAAAISLLRGKGLLVFVLLWLASGWRPYPRWLKAILNLGWVGVAGLILYLLLGPDPGDSIRTLATLLVLLWGAVFITAITLNATEIIRTWLEGQKLSEQLAQSEVRLRMDGGLTVKGGSAGLAFCLNTLLAAHAGPGRWTRRSWLWRRLFHRLRRHGRDWAATGIITGDGFLEPVVIEPKLRACLQSDTVENLLTPRQPGAKNQVINRAAKTITPVPAWPLPASPVGEVRLGFAAENQLLHVYPCRHLAQAVMRLGDFASPLQRGLNILAVLVSVAMLCAFPDLKAILSPPSAPTVVAPSSSSSYYLWVSLATKDPGCFRVVLESDFWSNRRVNVTAQRGASTPARAEILLRRQSHPSGREDDATIWVERRLRFLTREYAPGEHVGRYSLSYLTHLGHE
jgi:hypothetical protein